MCQSAHIAVSMVKGRKLCKHVVKEKQRTVKAAKVEGDHAVVSRFKGDECSIHLWWKQELNLVAVAKPRKIFQFDGQLRKLISEALEWRLIGYLEDLHDRGLTMMHKMICHKATRVCTELEEEDLELFLNTSWSQNFCIDNNFTTPTCWNDSFPRNTSRSGS